MQIKRVRAGYYTATKSNRVFEIEKLELGNYRNWWIVSTNHGQLYSDPVQTYKEAKAIFENW